MNLSYSHTTSTIENIGFYSSNSAHPYGMLLPGKRLLAGMADDGTSSHYTDAHGTEASAEYRYGFQGQEMDDEVKGKGNSVNYKYRMHDPRIGRFFAVDPLAPMYPHYSPYGFSGNHVINSVELEGLEDRVVIYNNTQYEDGTWSETSELVSLTWEEYQRDWKQNDSPSQIGPQGYGTLEVRQMWSYSKDGSVPITEFKNFISEGYDPLDMAAMERHYSVLEVSSSESPDVVVESAPVALNTVDKFNPKKMKISAQGAAFIANYETMQLKIYDDNGSKAGGYATIGVGHLIHKGQPGTNPTAEKPFINGITEEQAIKLFQEDLEIYETDVRKSVKVNLTQNQYDALVSFAFNAGGNFKSSTLLKKVNAGANAQEIEAQFVRWIYAENKKNAGLYNRRRDEADMYNEGNYTRDYNDTMKTVKFPD